MIDFFRNIFPPRIQPATIDLLIRVFEKLDDPKYEPYTRQLRDGLLRFVHRSRTQPNYFGFTYAPDVSGRYEDRLGRFMRISGIAIGNASSSDVIAIYMTYGLVCGLEFEYEARPNSTWDSIDVSKAQIEYLDFEIAEVKACLSKEEIRLINWSDVYEVELDGVTYFHIMDIGDGDFIAIDSTGLRFEIRHDPYEVIQRSENLGELITEFQRLSG